MNAIIENIGQDKDKLLQNVNLARSGAEIGYTRKKDSEPSLEADVIFRKEQVA